MIQRFVERLQLGGGTTRARESVSKKGSSTVPSQNRPPDGRLCAPHRPTLVEGAATGDGKPTTLPTIRTQNDGAPFRRIERLVPACERDRELIVTAGRDELEPLASAGT
jgi:hypothetical protein